MKLASTIAVALLFVSRTAAAEVRVKTTPTTAIPGAAVLVTVTGAKAAPSGKAGAAKLHFFAARGGYQAVAAIPLDHEPGSFKIEVEGAPGSAVVAVKKHTFPEAKLIVEEELANPDAADRDRIDADNVAIRKAMDDASAVPAFSGKFAPAQRGAVTSVFGEWRTFNDGHRSQHLGLDLGARAGSAVAAPAAGRVALVRECLLAGNVVVVVHGGGISTAFFHLDKTAVKEGDEVKQGAKLGTVGMSGRTTGAHLHMSVGVGGALVDPASFLRLALRPAPRTD